MKYRLKRKYLVFATILITVLSGLFIQLCITRVKEIKKAVHECDLAIGYSCDYYSFRNYLINK